MSTFTVKVGLYTYSPVRLRMHPIRQEHSSVALGVVFGPVLISYP
jgi:hypothetical protein